MSSATAARLLGWYCGGMVSPWAVWGWVQASIHAVTAEGFELKVALFVVAYSIDCYLSNL
jgi:hypothetical protein